MSPKKRLSACDAERDQAMARLCGQGYVAPAQSSELSRFPTPGGESGPNKSVYLLFGSRQGNLRSLVPVSHGPASTKLELLPSSATM